jgi:uroporphyrin-III C-methyltransferase
MGVHNLPYIIGELTKAGRSPETPIALIRWGTTPQQQQLIGTFSTIMDQIEATGFEAPAIAVIGAVVNLHDLLQAGQPLLSRTIPPTPISP